MGPRPTQGLNSWRSDQVTQNFSPPSPAVSPSLPPSPCPYVDRYKQGKFDKLVSVSPWSQTWISRKPVTDFKEWRRKSLWALFLLLSNFTGKIWAKSNYFKLKSSLLIKKPFHPVFINCSRNLVRAQYGTRCDLWDPHRLCFFKTYLYYLINCLVTNAVLKENLVSSRRLLALLVNFFLFFL